MIDRKGMRRRLSKKQRETVWKAADKFIERMEDTKTFTKNYGRLRLLRYLRTAPEDGGIRNISHLFLDEVQDLTPVALMILRELTRSAIIMAGDTDQSLYNYEAPFERAGFRLRGTTRVLRTNFRNTRQIHEFAERFQAMGAGEGDTAAEPFAFREGPPPEIYTGASAEELTDILLKNLSLYIDDLGYEPENICILVPRNREVDFVAGRLAAAGYSAEDITSPGFSFAGEGSIRISTLHSSKGLDFPVVFLYLPYLHRHGLYGKEEEELMARNLVFVGITRGMDSAVILTIDQDDSVIKDLLQAGGE